MEDSTLSIDDFEKVMTVLFPTTGAKWSRLADSDFDRISQLLTQVGKPQWSCRPRTYAVLRMIDRIDLFNTFILEGLKDIALPYTDTRLPNSLTPTAKAQFLQAQNSVLTKASDLEKSGGRHRHLDEDADAHFYILRILGRGGFGEVHHVRSKLSLEEYARKRVHRKKAFSKDREAIKMFENELANLKRLSHHHLVQFVGSYTDPKYVGILMSPVANCDLKVFLERNPFPKDDLHTLRGFFGCLCSAVLYLHNSKCRHKDLKPGNILVHSNNVLITDFGTARDWSELSHSTTTGRSGAYTPGYAAPEVVSEEPRGSAADIWSLGCVYLDMMTVLKGETLTARDQFFTTNGTGGAYPRSNGKALELWLAWLSSREDKEPIEWIKKMIKREPNDRITAAGLMERIHNYDGGCVYYNSCCNGEEESDDGTSYQGSIFEEVASGIRDSLISTDAGIADGSANNTTSSQGFNEASMQPQALPFRPRNEEDKPEPETVVAFQAPQQYSSKQPQTYKDNWNYARFSNFLLPSPSFENNSQEPQQVIYTIRLSGDYIVSAGRDKEIRIWDIKTGALIRGPLQGHSGSVLCVKFDCSEKENVIFSSSSDASFIVWEFSTGELKKRVADAHEAAVLSLCFDENYLATASKDKLIKVWTRKEQTLENAVNTSDESKSEYCPPYHLTRTLVGHTAAVNTIQLDKGEIFSGSGDRTIRIWNIETGACLKSIDAHRSGIACLEVDNGYIVTGSSDNTVRIFDRETGKEESCLIGHNNLVRSLQASFADNRIASGSYDGTVIVWQKDASDKWVIQDRLHVFDAFFNVASKYVEQHAVSGDKLLKSAKYNRIFAVRFDSRFLICSGESQIVGWDFSNKEMREDEPANPNPEPKSS